MPARRPGCRGRSPKWDWIFPRPRKSPRTLPFPGPAGLRPVPADRPVRSMLASGLPSTRRRQRLRTDPLAGTSARVNNGCRRRHVAWQRHDRPRQRGAAMGRGPRGHAASRRASPEGDDNGVGSVPRARSEAFDLHSMAIPVADPLPVRRAWPAALCRGGAGFASAIVRGRCRDQLDPARGWAASGGGKLPAKALARVLPARSEPSEIASQFGVTSPQPSGISGRGGRGDGQLDQILSGGGWGGGGIGRGNSQVVVSGQVH